MKNNRLHVCKHISDILFHIFRDMNQKKGKKITLYNIFYNFAKKIVMGMVQNLENTVKSLNNIKQMPGGRIILYGISAIGFVLSIALYFFTRR